MTRAFRRILIDNRGEIAVRVIRTCRRLGIETALTVSAADAHSLPARLADMTVPIGAAPGGGGAGYLSVDAVVSAAVATGSDAVHPGYGFLSENPLLARACADAGVVFIGPDPQTLGAAGDKLAARRHALAAGLPVLPGERALPGEHIVPGGSMQPAGSPPVPADCSHFAPDISDLSSIPGTESDVREVAARDAGDVARRIGFPVLVKAAGGGGGRGLRVVADPGGLADAVAVASAEAGAAFADPRVYLERYVSPARHVEVQILGDGDRVIHLGDRDCSVQRRYQKLIEEAPAPLLPAELADGLRRAAVAFGARLRYRGAGTVEFLVDPVREAFYFLEVNARIQVEHPVTEAVTGTDLVAEQIAIAEGRPLRLRQEGVVIAGHAIECRINAEDPDRGFLPSPGTVTRAVFPAGPRVRADTHVQAGSRVPPDYDSLLAKVIAHGADRGAALARLRSALGRCEIEGVATNLRLQRSLLERPEFARGGVATGWLEDVMRDQAPRSVPDMGGGVRG